MRCGAFAERISAYLEGELGPADREKMEEHMALCTRCAERLGGVRDVRMSLRALPRIMASPAFAVELRSRIQWIPSNRSSLKERILAFVPSPRSLPAMAGIGVVAALGAILLFGNIYQHDAGSTSELLVPPSSRVVEEGGEITNYVLRTVSPLEIDDIWDDTEFSVRDEPQEGEVRVRQVAF